MVLESKSMNVRIEHVHITSYRVHVTRARIELVWNTFVDLPLRDDVMNLAEFITMMVGMMASAANTSIEGMIRHLTARHGPWVARARGTVTTFMRAMEPTLRYPPEVCRRAFMQHALPIVDTFQHLPRLMEVD